MPDPIPENPTQVAIIGAAGKLGTRLVRIALNRGYRIVAMCREDYAACLLDSLENPGHHRRTLTVIPAK